MVELSQYKLLNQLGPYCGVIHICDINICNLLNNNLSLQLTNYFFIFFQNMEEVLVNSIVQTE